MKYSSSIPSSQYIRKIDDVIPNQEVKSLDIRRCYTSALINNTTPYNVFSAFDEIKPYKGRDPFMGEFYIDHDILWKLSIEIARWWYPASFVKYCLEKQYLSKEDIKWEIMPSQILKPDHFKKFAQEMVHMFPKHSKDGINGFIGELGKSNRWTEYGGSTDSFETAAAMKVAHENLSINKVGDLFFIRSRVAEPLKDGHLPIYRQILCHAYILLDQMYESAVLPQTRVIGYHCDSYVHQLAPIHFLRVYVKCHIFYET